jgi:uncharacterized protein (TIGR02145 family)
MTKLIIIGFIISFTNCNNSVSEHPDLNIQKKAILDSHKNQADTVIIGKQIWTTANLNTNTFRNGDTIFEAKTIDEFKKAGVEKKPAWCYYNNDSLNGLIYGKLYNWYAVNDARGLAPNQWHIPTINEWDTLTKFLGGETICGSKIRNTFGWHTEGNGNNSSGFSAIPGGNFMDYEFHSIGELGFWWAATKCYDGAAYARYLNYNYDPLKFASFSSTSGFSVRCVKN